MAIIGTTMRSLAEIAEKNPGYVAREKNGYRFENIRFPRTGSGKRDKSRVLADYTNPNGLKIQGVFNSSHHISFEA